MSLKSALQWLKAEPGRIHAFLTEHGHDLNNALDEAHTVTTTAAAAATIAGANGLAAALNKAAGGLVMVESTVTAETNASTFTAAAAGVTALANGLVQSGDINVKSDATKADVQNVADKLNRVVAVLQAAAATATTAAASTPA